MVRLTVADTTFLIDFLEGEAAAVELATVHREQGWPLYVPDIAAYELHRGMAQVGRPDPKWARIRKALESCHRLALGDEAVRIGGQLEGRLKSGGTPIDVEDCMIAGIALAHGEPVLTRNVKDFGRVTGLQVETY